MKPRVRIVRDLDDAPATTRYLNRLHRPAPGVIVVRPTPGRGRSGIARDILAALGKRFRPGSPRLGANGYSRWPGSGCTPNAPDTS